MSQQKGQNRCENQQKQCHRFQIEIQYMSSIFHFLSQFCEWISTLVMCQWAGPVLDLLLEYTAHVQPCSKLSELLDSREEWLAVKRKSRKHQLKPSIALWLSATLIFHGYQSDNPLSFSPTVSPRPLLHLCRLKIRTQMGRHRLKSLTSLPLPDRLITYLSYG